MKYYIYILSAALLAAIMAGCSNDEIAEKQHIGSSLRGEVPEGWFVATFTTSMTRAEADFDEVRGEDPRVFDLRYLIYEADGTFVKERLIFDDFDADTDDTQDWPLPSITDTLPVGNYKAVFVANTDPDLFSKGSDTISMPMPDDLLTDYKLGFDQARLNLPYLLGADDPDFFMDVIEFSNIDSDEEVYLQRIVGIFKGYRSLVDVQEALDSLVYSLVDDIVSKDLVSELVLPALRDAVGGVVGDALDLILDGIRLPLPPLIPQPSLGGLVEAIAGVLLDPLVNTLLDPVVDVLYDKLLEAIIHEVGSILETNNGNVPLVNLLGPLLNPWTYADGAVVTVTNQPTQFGFDMEVKRRDPNPHKYYIPIVSDTTDGERKRVVITKFLGFADIDGDGVGEEMITLNRINAAMPGLVGGVLLDDVAESKYLLNGALFDIEDELFINAPGNLKIYNEYSLADLGIDDYSQQEENLTISLDALDVANLKGALGGLPDGLFNGLDVSIPLIPISFGLNDIFELVGFSLEGLTDRLTTALLGDSGLGINGGLTDLSITVPVNLPILRLDALNVSGSWDPENTVEESGQQVDPEP